jgi:hypothetical protein
MNQPALQLMLDDVRKSTDKTVQESDEILSEINNVRQLFSRWTVELLVSNRGGSPAALLPYASLVVHTEKSMVDGKPYGKVINLPLERSTSTGATPLRLEPGGADVVRFSSTKFVGNSEEEQMLLDIFRVGGADAELRIQVVSSGNPLPRTFITTTFRFARQSPESN